MGTYPAAVSNPYKCNKGLRECRGRLPVMCINNHLVSAEAFRPRSEYIPNDFSNAYTFVFVFS